MTAKRSRESLKTVDRQGTEQQMLTPEEIAERRRARRVLEDKRLAMEEAVERRACESVYDKIWRHRSTLDEVRDEKLRSRTAALALVGIGLHELGVNINSIKDDCQVDMVDQKARVSESFSSARESLMRMNDEKFPFGKLLHLAAAHKSIVDILSTMQSSSSSADEILPTLIYTILTAPSEGINIISNLHFIQRFRAVSKVDGEAAYCLTNLEAAISFLETVDLASLRADELLEGPAKSNSRPSTPVVEKKIPFGPLQPSSSTLSSPSTTPAVGKYSKPNDLMSEKSLASPATSHTSTPTSPLHQRRLSHLLQPSTNVIGAASDAVRTTADQGFKNISNTLDNSFKFLFGRLKEQEMSKNGNISVTIPRTLDDARRLVSPTRPPEESDSINSVSFVAEQNEAPVDKIIVGTEDRVLGLIGGHKPSRERSVDSTHSNGSGKRVSFVSGNVPSSTSSSVTPPTSSAPGNAAIESMRNLGNTLNPLNRLAGMNVMRSFGRTASNTPPALQASAEKCKELGTMDENTTAESQSGPWRMAKLSPQFPAFWRLTGREI